MKSTLWFLVVLRFVAGSNIITRSMIHEPREINYERVPLIMKPTEEHQLKNVTDFERDEKESEESDEHFEGRDADDDFSDSTEDYEDSTETPELVNRTKLYPIGRLWEKQEPTDIWSVIQAAFSCIWSGLGVDCFSYRVVPMVKSMIGYHPELPYGQPYGLPRDSNIEDEGRRRRKTMFGMKLFKHAMVGIALLKTILLPSLAALSLVSGKAMIFSVLSVLLTGAVAWTGFKSADRRVATGEQNSQFFM